jgi:hypothetical protein
MATRSIVAVQCKSQIQFIRVHNDGYPTGVGRVLLTCYGPIAKVRKLIAAGNVSSLKSVPSECAPLGGFTSQPSLAINRAGLTRIFGDSDADYCYLRYGRTWYQLTRDGATIPIRDIPGVAI